MRALFIPRAQVTPAWPTPHTGLTGSDSLFSFARVNVLVSSLLSCVDVVSSLVQFGAQEVKLPDLGFPGSDRSDG
jgi:hypothetical protein